MAGKEGKSVEARAAVMGRGGTASVGRRRWSFAGITLDEVALPNDEPKSAGTAVLYERHCLVVLQIEGDSASVHGEAPVLLRAGDIAILTNGPVVWSRRAGRCRQLRLHLPQAWIASRMRTRGFPAPHILGSTSGLGRLLAGLLAGLPSLSLPEAASLNAPAEAAVRDAIVNLIVAALTAASPCRGHDYRNGGVVRRAGAWAVAQRWRAVSAFVEAHLPEPSLSPEDVARAHGISKRQLHRLFRDAGTSFSAYIRDLRLAQCRTDLTDPRCAALPVTEIAFRWGFSDSAHFSRSFRAAYGTTPRALRNRRCRLLEPGGDATT